MAFVNRSFIIHPSGNSAERWVVGEAKNDGSWVKRRIGNGKRVCTYVRDNILCVQSHLDKEIFPRRYSGFEYTDLSRKKGLLLLASEFACVLRQESNILAAGKVCPPACC